MFAIDSLWMVLLYLFIALLLRMRFRNGATIVLLFIVLIGAMGAVVRDYRREIFNAWENARAVATNWRGDVEWPPRLNESYPDLLLYDQEGSVTRLSSFKGKVILVEMVGMSCPACVALSGGQLYGGFEGTSPQSDLESLDSYVQRFAGLKLNDPRLVFVQLVLFNPEMQPPTPDDARRWAEHFRLHRSKNYIVLAGDERLAMDASRQLVPGFQLIDRDFILRGDSTGSSPAHDLYEDLFPMLRDLVDQR